MFQLLLAVCVSSTVCQYQVPPLAYETAEVCRLQAALVAGLVAGQHPPSDRVTYRYRCLPIGAEAAQGDWVEVDLAAGTAQSR